MEDMSADNEDWNFEGTSGLDEVEWFSVKRRFRDLQELCRVKHWKVPETVAEGVEFE